MMRRSAGIWGIDDCSANRTNAVVPVRRQRRRYPNGSRADDVRNGRTWLGQIHIFRAHSFRSANEFLHDRHLIVRAVDQAQVESRGILLVKANIGAAGKSEISDGIDAQCAPEAADRTSVG